MMKTTTRIYSVCTTYSGELVRRIEAESDYEARYIVGRITGRSMDFLTTEKKPRETVDEEA